MARRPLRELRQVLGLLAVPGVLGVMGVAGCAAGSPPAPAPPPEGAADVVRPLDPARSPDGSPRDPRGTASADPRIEAAALAVTTAWFSWDTRVDARPNDTARRLALRWLAPEARRHVVAFAGDAAPGADWARWSARRARATVTCRLGADDRPPDGVDQAWRQVVATITLHGDQGWTEVVERTVFLQLTLIDGTWMVSDLR